MKNIRERLLATLVKNGIEYDTAVHLSQYNVREALHIINTIKHNDKSVVRSGEWGISASDSQIDEKQEG